MRKLNTKYAEGPGALVGELRHLKSTIAGNRDFLAYLRNTKTFYDKVSGRELNLTLIDYEHPEKNIFEVTEAAEEQRVTTRKRASAREKFAQRTRCWAARLAVRVRSVTIRKMQRKWASCSTAGRLTFDESLLSKSSQLQDYVIVHELGPSPRCPKTWLLAAGKPNSAYTTNDLVRPATN